MIDKWFKKDLDAIYANHNIAVFIDEDNSAEFLVKTIGTEIDIFRTSSEIEELHTKYSIEKEQPSDKKYLIYTSTKKDDLKFIREYCETNGLIEIRYLHNYVKEKVHTELNININLPTEDLVAAAKVSIGKDKAYWIDISHKGASEIFDMEKELIPFLHNPGEFEKNKYDPALRETFYRKINAMLKQPHVEKPSNTLAKEVVDFMLEGLLNNNCDKTLESIYKNWLDSVSYCDSFKSYVKNYNIKNAADIWNINTDHPLREIDERWLSEVGKNLSDKGFVKDVIGKMSRRNKSKQALSLNINFWKDVLALLSFDPKDISYLNSLAECIDFYKKHFCILDTSIRNLYTEFLNKKELLEPFQEIYKEHVSVFLDKWFKFWEEYRENQTGTLQRIIDESGEIKVAVIVADGVAYEVAEQISEKLRDRFSIKKGSIIADIPSETENNMSRIYIDNDATEPVHKNREKYLKVQNTGKSIEFVNLEDINSEIRQAQFLICTHKDLDELGEKLQQKALKYFPEMIKDFAEKISLLLNSGYSRVFLISDHGFVLTGILSEADKITPSLKDIVKTAERYVLLNKVEKKSYSEWIIAEKNNGYIGFSKNINPFKSVGRYGFSHGGLTPQEIVTPFFCWEKKASVQNLKITIDNKEDLKEVTGDYFEIKISSASTVDNVFAAERKIQILFFADDIMVNKSDIISICLDNELKKEYSFDNNSKISIIIIDAVTQEQLDRAEVNKDNARNFGGLL